MIYLQEKVVTLGNRLSRNAIKEMLPRWLIRDMAYPTSRDVGMLFAFFTFSRDRL